MGITAAIAATALIVGSGIVKAAGEKAQGEFQRDIHDYNSQVSRQNAQIQEENAKIARQTADQNAIFAEQSAQFAEYSAEAAEARAQDAEKRGETEEQIHRRKIRQLMGRQRAILAAQGQDISGDSGLDILIDTAELSEIDAIIIRNNAALESWGYRAESYDQRVRAYNERVRGFNILEAGKMDERNFLAAATNYNAQAESLTMQGDLARMAGRSRATGTLLDTATSAYAVGRTAFPASPRSGPVVPAYASRSPLGGASYT